MNPISQQLRPHENFLKNASEFSDKVKNLNNADMLFQNKNTSDEIAMIKFHLKDFFNDPTSHSCKPIKGKLKMTTLASIDRSQYQFLLIELSCSQKVVVII